jgi:VWFA-related protein
MSKLLRLIICVALLVELSSFLARAQVAEEAQRTIRKSVNLVLVDVFVSDTKGNSLSDLRAQDFELFDETNVQEIAHFSRDELPLAIALVVDASSSMQGDFESIRIGLSQAMLSLKPEDRVALISFGDTAKVHIPLTNDIETLSAAAGRLRAHGSTNMNDGVYVAIQLLHGAIPGSRKVVVLITDNTPNVAGSATPEKINKKLLESEISLFAILSPSHAAGVSNGLVGYQEAEPGTVFAEEFVGESGGFVMDTFGKSGIHKALVTLFQILRARYTVGFYPQASGKPGSTRRIRMRLKHDSGQDSKTPTGFYLRYRQKYVVPRAENQAGSKMGARRQQ